jgi:hypothetical protein
MAKDKLHVMAEGGPEESSGHILRLPGSLSRRTTVRFLAQATTRVHGNRLRGQYQNSPDRTAAVQIYEGASRCEPFALRWPNLDQEHDCIGASREGVGKGRN